MSKRVFHFMRWHFDVEIAEEMFAFDRLEERCVILQIERVMCESLSLCLVALDMQGKRCCYV